MRPAVIAAVAVLAALVSCLAFTGLAQESSPSGTNAWVSGAGFRYRPLSVPSGGQAGFALVPPSETGINFSNRLTLETLAGNRLLEIGSGVALGDVDGDGRVDVYFCRTEGDNVLYRNRGGWRFEDITAASGVACPGQFSTGAAFADLDGDDDLDLLVSCLGGGIRVFHNDGQGRFPEDGDSGLARTFGATSMALADVDGDGDLDLYATNYRTDTFHDNPRSINIQTRRRPDGSTEVEPATRFLGLTTEAGGLEVLERGEPDFFYVNRGTGKFVPAPWNVGVFLDENGTALKEPPTDWGLAVIFRDLNGDGLPDLYVCNDFVYWPDRIWLNQGGKRFRAAPPTAFRSVSLSAMAVDVADINRDGWDDVFVADMLSPNRESRAWQRPDTLSGTVKWPIHNPEFRPEVTHNTLHLARGDGTFAEIARLAGVFATDWTWSAAFADVDLDGWEDLLVTTGANHDVQDLDAVLEMARGGGWKSREQRVRDLGRLPRRETPSVALRNRRDLTFENRSAEWGFDQVGVAHGMALGDLDGDGDLDVVVNCLNAPARVLRNQSSAPRVAVRLQGAGRNTRGIGGRIRVSGGPVRQTQEIMAGGRYLSGDDPLRAFAAGDAAQLDVEVTWRSGRQSRVTGVRPNTEILVDEASADTNRISQMSRGASPEPLFQNVSSNLALISRHERLDDFARQPLLPRSLGTLGPGIAWWDSDGDGRDELVVGGGRGGTLSRARFDAGGRWTVETTAAPLGEAREHTGLTLWPGPQGSQLLVGESPWDGGASNRPPFWALKPDGTWDSKPAVQHPPTVTGPLAAADVDGVGSLELFVGGRAVPGRYPEPADSWLLRMQEGRWAVAQAFPKLGRISGAVFSDMDGDGDPDLILAGEWASPRVFRNDSGNLVDATAALGLDGWTGLWNGVAAGDFDGDGRMDFVMSNAGRNGRIDSVGLTPPPVRLHYGDWAGTGEIQTVLASWDPVLSKVTPWRDRKALLRSIPSVAERAGSFHQYGRMSVDELLGDGGRGAAVLEATTLDSMVFLNRGSRFEARPLPVEAQFSTAFGISVADWDGDGREDLFLAQNFFGVDAETSRQDAGTGLVLLGDGRGGFRALSPLASGVFIPGEQRGCAVADFDQDGRVDVAVGQNAGAVQLLRNAGGRPGRRVELRGPRGNPNAIGAAARLRWEGGDGPVREIHAGTGYGSQDSVMLTLGSPTEPRAVEVRWPGGVRREYAWPLGAMRHQVRADEP